MISRLFKGFLWLLVVVLLFVLARYWGHLDGKVAAACIPAGMDENGSFLDQLSRFQEAVLRLQAQLNAPVDSLDVMADKATAVRPSPENVEAAPSVTDGKSIEAEMLRIQNCINQLKR